MRKKEEKRGRSERGKGGRGRRGKGGRLKSRRENVQLITGVSPGMMTKDPWGSIATRQALRMLGVSAAEMPHILQVSFRRLLSDWRFLLLSRMLQSRKDSSGSVHGSTLLVKYSVKVRTKWHHLGL